ncbi:hypothetical protein ABLB37_19200 [Vibrio parahaemolyticus]|uniref:hypothetical protein n=1 Tax=Vibrio harveyi group TaxID=717610 RepID=UPI0015F3BE98|nr:MULTISPECIES: hypothetical protein [Vibrio harveyi group]EJE8520994.1 hypothetical protein [Vibrio parahaemolyticus]MBS9948799.1 hypothetical protein [Vibrio alginolyticus]
MFSLFKRAKSRTEVANIIDDHLGRLVHKLDSKTVADLITVGTSEHVGAAAIKIDFKMMPKIDSDVLAALVLINSAFTPEWNASSDLYIEAVGTIINERLKGKFLSADDERLSQLILDRYEFGLKQVTISSLGDML